MDAKQAKKIFVIVALAVVATTSILAVVFPYSTDPAADVVWYKRVPGFAAMLGLLGCLVMVPLVKTFAKKVLQRPEDYYSPLEDRLAAMTGPAPGTSLADPSAPSESEEGEPAERAEAGDEDLREAAASMTKGGRHG